MKEKFFIVIIILLSILPAIFLYPTSSRILTFDEIDYIKAARRGFFENYFERNTLDLISFYTLGKVK
ncbi:MAG: hypothetical protein Q3M24_17940 [Candidatus Electrothrix aestuarii]|uniref:Uncharacterized protein n=1 Tax=Candidatus Electrothrix aestuarii TaxID=3062594 RepID=A0AAU8LS81_9BACT|nr:hypothetical protein [Candidatus Electrothrix aestuarii]